MTDEKYCAHRMLWIVLAATFGCSVHAPEHYAGSVASTAASLSASEFRSDHPRLWLYSADWDPKKQTVENNSTLLGMRDLMKNEADSLASEALFNCEISAGNIGRVLMDRVYLFGALGHLLPQGESPQTYLDRAVDELMTVTFERCENQPGNPLLVDHYISRNDEMVVGELANAVAVGYDWLYGELSSTERNNVRDVLAKFIDFGISAMQNNEFWTRGVYNHNTVPNAGLGVAALAVLHDGSSALDSKATDLLDYILNEHPTDSESNMGSIDYGLSGYNAGDWHEGPLYWNYQTRYAVLLMKNLETARANDNSNMGLSNAPGFLDTHRFLVYVEGPAGQAFNYSDSPNDYTTGSVGDALPFMSYIGRLLGGDQGDRARKVAWDEMVAEIADGDLDMRPFFAAYHLMAYEGTGGSPPNDASFARFSDTVFFRSDWSSGASWVALLADQNLPVGQVFHPQLDVGSFALQADGVDWAVELGSDNYGLDDYGSEPYDQGYYRINTIGHNTLRIQNANQSWGEGVDATWYGGAVSASGRGFQRIDMTSAYGEPSWGITEAIRGVAQVGYPRNIVLLYDRITRSGSGSVEVDWQMHTRAQEATISDGNRVIELTRNGKKLRMYLLSPTYGSFTFSPYGANNNRKCNAAQPSTCPVTDPNDPDCICEYDRSEFRRVAVESNFSAGIVIKVLFVPESAAPFFSKSLVEMENCINQVPTNCIHPGAQSVLTDKVKDWQ